MLAIIASGLAPMAQQSASDTDTAAAQARARAQVLTRLEGSVASRSPRNVPLPDTSIAAGPWRLLSSADDLLRHMARNGLEPQDRRGATLFPDEVGAGPTAVLFDRLSSRAFAAGVNTRNEESVLHLAVNATNQILRMPAGDPLSELGWCTYRFDLGLVIEDPGLDLGSNERWLAATIRPAAAGEAIVAVIDKSKLVDYTAIGVCPQVSVKLFQVSAADRGITPAAHYTRSPARRPPLYLLSSRVDADGADSYSLWMISGGSSPDLRRVTLQADEYRPPPAVPQRGGGTISIGDGGIAAAVYRDGHLWGVHSVACPSDSDRACLRVLEMDPDSGARRPTSVGLRTIAGRRGWSLWMPGIGVNKNGDVAVSFLRSRNNKFAGTAAAILGRGETDFGPESSLIVGKCALAQGLNGAPSIAVQADPFDDLSFWVNAPAPVLLGSCRWSTQPTRFAVRSGTGPPSTPLADGTFSLPSTTQFSGPGFHQPFEATARLPAALASSSGARLVLRLRDRGRPDESCGDEHPLSGCATIDYSEPLATFDNFVTLATVAGPRTYHLSDGQILSAEPIRRPG